MAKKVKNAKFRRKSGFAGAPTDKGWHYFYEYVRLYVDRKDIMAKVKGYIKTTYKAKERKLLLGATDTVYGTSYALAAALAFNEAGFAMPKGWNYDTLLELKIGEIKRRAIKRFAEKEDAEEDKPKVKKTPAAAQRAIADELIGEVEAQVDLFFTNDLKTKFSMFEFLAKHNVSAPTATMIRNSYLRLQAELDELVNLPIKAKQNAMQKQLAEGYAEYNASDKRKLAKFVTTLVDECEALAMTKKAQRKPRKVKAKSADKIVSKIVYMKDSPEFKIASVDPTSLVGAKRVYLFNTKYRVLTELVASKEAGLTIRGTSLYDYDDKLSRATKLRKPLEFLPMVLSRTPIQLDKEWKKLTTKSTKFSGRISSDVIIMKVSNK